MTLRLRTFGAVYLERDGAPLRGAHTQRRRLALLAHLAATESAAVAREKLIALLWPDSDEASGRHSLSQLLYSLRHDLGADAIVVDAVSVRLDSSVLESDVHAFDEAMARGRFEDAAALYRGAFLDGFHVEDAPEFNRWIDDESSRRAHACARALERLADASERAKDWHRAVDWLRRRAALDPTHARATQRLMQALAAIGDRDGALRAAHIYETLVRGDLEATPDPIVARYADELRRLPTSVARVSPSPAPLPAPPPASAGSPAPTSRPSQAAPARRASSARKVVARSTVWAIVAIALVMVLTSLAFALRRGRVGDDTTLAKRTGATVVIGDFDGTDSVLALAVREALRAELVNTAGVLVTSDMGIRELKTLMRLPVDAPLRRPELLALATRSGANVAITGSVVPVGTGAQIVLELVDPSSGRSIRSFAERPADGAATLSAVGRLAQSIGAAVSHAPRDTTVHPLPAVTTSSLAALKSYALARQMAALGRRREAVAPAERALAHDSLFVLAHYFLGDLLWFIDEQTHSEAHLTKAYQLIATVPKREQLVIRARYEQLARDRPDSALTYWQLLEDASPGDVLAYEGRTWALRALGRHEEAAASADTAMTLDPGAILPNTNNALYSWLAVGDTLNAVRVGRRVATRYPDALVEARFFSAAFHDPRASLTWVDSTTSPVLRHWRRHLAQVAMGDVVGSRATLDSILSDDRAQFTPNALVNQAWIELVSGGGRQAAARDARAALDWTRRRDLSPPAVGRLAERIADIAARAGDESTVNAATALVRERDHGRGLRTYVMAMRTLEAAQAYVRGDFGVAAERAEVARHGVYFSRSLATIVQLEADARRAVGETMAADSLARLVATHQIVDSNFEAWAVLRAVIAHRDAAHLTAAASRD